VEQNIHQNDLEAVCCDKSAPSTHVAAAIFRFRLHFLTLCFNFGESQCSPENEVDHLISA